ncbi:astacin (peptidase family M12A) [Mucilaginibacter oryzae]|uniref:Astacin (Peptidase family M12A) n=1 Tax=Mucilaginibacter oryzae TaxID=468058 RepID=A0A316HAI5_9SPHI|nr:astacin (peptidase family M12A) [Mucilaginibacter oryzae]
MHYLEIKGEAVWKGDIILSKAQLKADTSKSLFGAATLGRRWPDGIVYHKIDSALPNQSRITDAIKNWETHSNVRFKVADAVTENYVLFTTGGGCSSYIGMTRGEHFTHLANGCSVGNVVR